MIAPFDYRQTFLTGHVERESTRIDDIAPLAELAAPCVHGENRVLSQEAIRQFFYGAPGANPVYLPIETFSLENPAERYRDVAEMIEQTHGKVGIPGGILLGARSGAGKTLSLRKACCDCFWRPDTPAIPSRGLAGYLPCFVRPADFGDPREKDFIHHLLCGAAFQGSAKERDIRRIKQWLNDGPPLLIIADLNSVSAELRVDVAEHFRRFQREYGAAGHRCLLEYRTNQSVDPVLDVLLAQPRVFRPFDLAPPTVGETKQYFASWASFARRWEASMTSPASSKENSAAPALDPRLAKLAITTPWLMHLAAEQIRSDGAASESSWQLYEQLVDRHLERDRARYPRTFGGPGGRNVLMGVMSRLALAMLARRSGATQFSHSAVTALLSAPLDACWNASAKRGWLDWRPAPGFWQDGPKGEAYYRESFRDPERIDELLRFSLLRREGSHIKFLHDSLIYFFAARALRYYDTPDLPRGVPSNWPAFLAARLAENPSAWLPAAEFLAGAIDQQVRDYDFPASEAIFSLLACSMSAEDPVAVARLARELALAMKSVDPGLAAIRHGFTRNGTLAVESPGAAVQEVYHSLAGQSEDRHELRGLAERLFAAVKNSQQPWLRQLEGPRLSGAQAVAFHPRFVEVLAPLPDHRIATGSGDGGVRVWSPLTGRLDTLARHTTPIKCLVATSQGRIVASALDHTGEISIADLTGQDPPCWIQHGARVICLLALPSGEVLSAGVDGRVLLIHPDTATEKCIANVADSIGAMVAGPSGEVAVATERSRLFVSRPKSSDLTTYELTQPATALLWLGNGEFASGHADGSVMIWKQVHSNPPSDWTPRRVIAPTGEPVHWLLPVAKGGWIVVTDRQLAFWRRDRDADECTIAWRRDAGKGRKPLAILSNDRLALARRDEIEIVDISTGEPIGPSLIGHFHSVTDIVSIDEETMATAGLDGSARLWNLRDSARHVEREIRLANACCVFLPGGQLATNTPYVGGHQPIPHGWIDAHGLERLHVPWDWFVGSRDGRSVWGARDGRIVHWRMGADIVDELALRPDGAVSLIERLDGELLLRTSSGKMHRLPSGASEFLPVPFPAFIESFLELPSGKIILATRAGELICLDIMLRACRISKVSRDPPLCMAIWSDDEVLFGDKNANLRIWNSGSGAKRIRRWRRKPGWTTHLAVDPGRFVAWADGARLGMMELRRPSSSPLQWVADRRIAGISLSPTDRLLAAVVEGGVLSLLAIEPR